MSKIYGESEVYSYSNEGGISLFAIDPPGGAVVGGSGDPSEGSGATATRFRWWILDNGDGTYQGGISGVGWFRSTDTKHPGSAQYPGPFEGMTDAQIYQAVQDNAGTLNSVFADWNSTHGVPGDTTIARFTLIVQENALAADCVTPGGAQG